MRIALAQINTDGNIERNLQTVSKYVQLGAQQGAQLIVFPEATMSAFGTDLVTASMEHGSSWRRDVSTLAQQYSITIAVGEFEASLDGRVRNLVGIYKPNGDRNSYAKIHLYDAFGYKESDSVEAGNEPLTVEIDGVTIGFATCYDIRFPKLFAELSRAGAEVIVVPASWGAGPGKVEQWEILARARALDSNSFVVALDQADPALTGVKVEPTAPTGVGHSLVSDPFGHAVAKFGGDEELKVIDLDLSLVKDAQKTIPVLKNAQLGY